MIEQRARYAAPKAKQPKSRVAWAKQQLDKYAELIESGVKGRIVLNFGTDARTIQLDQWELLQQAE